MKKLVVSTVILAMGLSTWGIAQAGSGENTAPAGKPAPQRVNSTVAGMPPTAQTMYAVVNADGTKDRSFPSATTAPLGPGRYEVLFTGRNLVDCSYQATIGNAGTGTSLDGFIQVDARAAAPSGVFIKTQDTAGVQADRPFHLAVHC